MPLNKETGQKQNQFNVWREDYANKEGVWKICVTNDELIRTGIILVGHWPIVSVDFSLRWFSLFNGISTFVGYLMPKQFS